MECTVPVEVHLATEHADVGSLERTVSAALAEVGVRRWQELVERLELRVQHTLGVRERGLWLVTEMSYQRAVDQQDLTMRMGCAGSPD